MKKIVILALLVAPYLDAVAAARWLAPATFGLPASRPPHARRALVIAVVHILGMRV